MLSDSRQFELFFETAVDMLCVTDSKGVIQRVNPSWSRVLGWSSEELCGHRYLEFVHPDDRAASIEAEKGLMQDKRLGCFNNRYRTKSGEYRELEWSVVIEASEGLIFATARDMTDNARATVLADAVEKVSGVGSWRLSPDADGPEWSEMVFHIHDLPVGEMPALQNALDFYPPSARELITEKLGALQANGEAFDVEVPFITAKGRRRIVRSTGAREEDCCCGGELYGTFQDITEMKRDEHRLAEIIRGTNAGTWQWNVQSGECFFNDRWADLVGYDLDELAPHSVDTWLELTHPDDSAESARRLEAHFAGETEFYQNEMRMKHKNGHWVWVLATGCVGTRTEDGEPEWVSGTHIDITQQKQHEAEINAAREAAEAANEAKSRFLATVSHEVRTPMNGVLGMAEILGREINDPAQLTKVKLIKESGELLINVLNDILDFSKIEAGKVELESAAFVPGEILRRVSRTYEGAARDKNISLSLVTRGDGERQRRGDETRIGQVLNNLVSNAVKFTTEGEVILTSVFEDNEVTFEVRDTGIGMSADAVETIFDPFTQADTSITRRFGGTGLGMSITKKLVDIMGGEISIESEPSVGTKILVSLPLSIEASVSTQGLAHREVAGGQNRSSSSGRALVIDDNGLNRTVMEYLLASLGIDAALEADGPAGIAAFAAGKYDVVFLDICMPQMDGHMVLEHLHALEKERGAEPTPIIACTANVMTHQVKAYREAGFSGCLGKPFDTEQLQEILLSIRGQEQDDLRQSWPSIVAAG